MHSSEFDEHTIMRNLYDIKPERWNPDTTKNKAGGTRKQCPKNKHEQVHTLCARAKKEDIFERAAELGRIIHVGNCHR